MVLKKSFVLVWRMVLKTSFLLAGWMVLKTSLVLAWRLLWKGLGLKIKKKIKIDVLVQGKYILSFQAI